MFLINYYLFVYLYWNILGEDILLITNYIKSICGGRHISAKWGLLLHD